MASGGLHPSLDVVLLEQKGSLCSSCVSKIVAIILFVLNLMLQNYESPNVFSVRSVRKWLLPNVSVQKIIMVLS